MVSPFNSFVGLTRQGAGVDPSCPRAVPDRRAQLRACLPDRRPRGRRARPARARSRRTRVFVLDDGDPGYGALQATAFETAAPRVGLEVVGRASWDPRADEYSVLARRVADSGAAAVYLGGLIDTNAGGVIRDLRRRLSGDVALLGPSGLAPVSLLVKKSDGAARGMYLSIQASCWSGCLLRRPAGRRASAPRSAAFQSSLPPCMPRRRLKCSSTPSRARTGRGAPSWKSCFALALRTACSATSRSTPTATSRKAR